MKSAVVDNVQPPLEGPDISIVLPCYRAPALAGRSVAELVHVLDESGYTWEVIVVDDGAGDLTPDLLGSDARVRLVVLPVNRGKGAAVRTGMLAATGRVRIYTDVDLPYDSALMVLIARYILERGFHVVIGDRTLSGSEYAKKLAWPRRVASTLFAMFVGKLVTGGFFDTQCGLKGMRGDIAEQMFRSARIDRFAFDVEVLYLALLARLDVKRIPVRLRRNDTSSIRLIRDSARMLVDVFRMKYYRSTNRYQTGALAQIAADDFERLRSTVSQAPTEFAQSPSSSANPAALLRY